MAGVSERVVDHLETMHPNEILSRSSQVEGIDTVARRTFGPDSSTAGSGALNLNVLSGGRALVACAINAGTLPERKIKSFYSDAAGAPEGMARFSARPFPRNLARYPERHMYFQSGVGRVLQ